AEHRRFALHGEISLRDTVDINPRISKPYRAGYGLDKIHIAGHGHICRPELTHEAKRKRKEAESPPAAGDAP
ncbi:MAG: hypothetical protein K2G17_01080, partial [Duncaniella sp.]|nr:hypothetical protein [Duncaniella sp.]